LRQEEVLGRRVNYRIAAVGCVLICAHTASAQQDEQHKLNAAYASAVSEYNSGQFAAAAGHLEAIEPSLSNHFEVEELMGLVYTSLSQDTKALSHLQAATKLKPASEPARTNLAACLSRLGRNAEAEQQFHKAASLAPQDYTANHNLGEFYLQSNRLALGIPFLEYAQRIKPSAQDNGYDLAAADLMAKQYVKARTVVESLLKLEDSGELHNLAAQIDEKDGQFVAAANQFEAAAHLDPSEDNLFDWGSELLLHRTYEPAIDVFRAAAKRYPASPRIAIGLGMSLYARGIYEEAVKALLTAADLTPSDPRCYLFLSRAYDSSPSEADEVIQHFRRYAELQPNNALAQYYYAMGLWKGKRVQGEAVDLQQVETLLTKAAALDGSLPEVHLQLGNLLVAQRQYEASIPEYKRAAALDPSLADAHYRLATDYGHLGDKAQAQAEIVIYQRLRSAHLAEVDKERAEVQQFVYSSKSDASTKQQSEHPQ
jgi:tetratricopeptide (TPR) repeat protein